MKKIRVILLSFMAIAMFYSAAVFTACNKATCNNIVCQNGGTCSNGKCSCPTGYTGASCQYRNNTYIQYINNTFTPITITVNSSTQTIPKGGSYTFVGPFGSNATGSATTSGATTSLGITAGGGIIGVPINWGVINNTFPASDTLKVPMDVGSTYFFLRMVNKSAHDVIDYYVNYQFTYGQTYEDITVPNNGTTYDMGYYLAYPSSNVQTQSAVTSSIEWKAVSLPGKSNQSFTVTIN